MWIWVWVWVFLVWVWLLAEGSICQCNAALSCPTELSDAALHLVLRDVLYRRRVPAPQRWHPFCQRLVPPLGVLRLACPDGS